MRKLIITILFMSISVVTFAQKIPANILKKATLYKNNQQEKDFKPYPKIK